METVPDLRLRAPATARNREPILAALSHLLPRRGLVLEISSGSGEHAAHFAGAFPHLQWQPSDLEPRALSSIAAYRHQAGLANLLAPRMLDATSDEWPFDHADAVVCINMIHIAPWRACEGLMAGAARILPDSGILYLYGPFRENGEHTAESNLRFDIDLRSRDPDWGVRNLEDVVALANINGLAHIESLIMPTNNRSIVFQKAG
jgi:hypothetical protein